MDVTTTAGGTVPGFLGIHQFASGTNVKLNVIPELGYEFVGWVGADGDQVVDNLLIMLDDLVIQAVFKDITIEDEEIVESLPTDQTLTIEDEHGETEVPKNSQYNATKGFVLAKFNL